MTLKKQAEIFAAQWGELKTRAWSIARDGYIQGYRRGVKEFRASVADAIEIRTGIHEHHSDLANLIRKYKAKI